MLASGVTFTVFLTLSKVQSASFDPGFLAFWRSGVALIVANVALMMVEHYPQPESLDDFLEFVSEWWEGREQ